MQKLILLNLLLITVSCNSQHGKETEAHIIQRRITAAGRLMLTYEYAGEKGRETDSMEVENRPLPKDTARLILPSRPGEKPRLLLP
jgi:hypothetical protein